MPIRQYLNGARFDFETTRVLGVALEMARWALRFEERDDGADAIIAKHIIALALGGERDADRLCDYALAKLLVERFKAAVLKPTFACTAQCYSVSFHPV